MLSSEISQRCLVKSQIMVNDERLMIAVYPKQVGIVYFLCFHATTSLGKFVL